MNRRKEEKVGFSMQLTVKEHELLSKVSLANHDSVSAWIRSAVKKEAKKLGIEVCDEQL